MILILKIKTVSNQSVLISLSLIQLIEKAEAREKERLKEEARKVCLQNQAFV